MKTEIYDTYLLHTLKLTKEQLDEIPVWKRQKLAEHLETVKPPDATEEKIESIVAEFNSRQTGKTTRAIDNYIQELFTKGIVTVVPEEGEKDIRYLYERIRRRLTSEHAGVLKSITYDKPKIKFGN